MRIWSAGLWIAAAATLLACSGCGFKGPLYLPERTGTVVTHPAQSARRAPARKGNESSQKGSPAAPPPPLH